MDWANERYVCIYTRDTADLLAVGWEGRLVMYELIRHADRAGVLDTGGDLAIVAELLRIPGEVCKVGLDRLSARGCIRISDRAIVLPNFIAAQETPRSDAQRARESRAARRERVMASDVTNRDGAITERDATITERDANVTAGHTASHAVTPCHSYPSDPIRSEPSDPDQVTAPLEPAVRKPAEKSHPDHAAFVSWFHERYREAYGAAPTWGGKQGQQVKRLLKAHGLEECRRRAERMFSDPPRWMSGAVDLGTLEQHFDKLVEAPRNRGSPRGGVTVEELLRGETSDGRKL